METDVNKIKRYSLSGDQRYSHNRMSNWNEKEMMFIYEDENGAWVRFEDIEKLKK